MIRLDQDLSYDRIRLSKYDAFIMVSPENSESDSAIAALKNLWKHIATYSQYRQWPFS